MGSCRKQQVASTHTLGRKEEEKNLPSLEIESGQPGKEAKNLTPKLPADITLLLLSESESALLLH